MSRPFSSLALATFLLGSLLAAPVAPQEAPAQAAPPSTPARSAPAPATPDRQYYRSEVPGSRAYGEWLFKGNFAAESLTGFNPDYLVSIGDKVDVKLWGAVEYEAALVVDPQGNLFLPRVGPIRLLNVRNGDLTRIVEQHVRTVFKNNVGVYASLQSARPVKVFVSGFVASPGLYGGFSGDSLLRFLDLAGGISPESGSYLDVRLIREGKTQSTVNLYDFLLKGSIPTIQFRDGDVVFVGPIRSTARFTGAVEIPSRIEFTAGGLRLADALAMIRPGAAATHAKIVSNSGLQRSAVYEPISGAADLLLADGDEVEIVTDRLRDTVVVDVEGEHFGHSRYVLPYSATMVELLAKIRPAPEADMGGLQLFRKSLAARQKALLQESLRTLESTVLATRSATTGEAELRTKEAQLILKFIERAQLLEPRGQVVLPGDTDLSRIKLEDGDKLYIPRKSQLVSVHGEVYFANVFAFREGAGVDSYIQAAGGFTQQAGNVRVIVMHQNGEVELHHRGSMFSQVKVLPGDEIMVLPEVNVKTFQIGKDIVEVIYQIAVATRAIVRL